MTKRRVPPIVASVLLRSAMVVLLAQGAWAWASLLGIAVADTNFDTMAPASRNLAVLLAVICPVAAIGTWFTADWGPVLWALVVVSLGVAANAASVASWVDWTFAAHGALITLWALASVFAERRRG